MSIQAAVFASGGGSNFQSLLDYPHPDEPYRIRLLVSDRPDAGALDRARRAGVATAVVQVKGREAKVVAEETLGALREHQVQAVFLAGYLRLIPSAVVASFPRRILNIHPALLPAFGGKGMWGHHVHEAVLASGATLSGPTIHFVDEEYDTGSIFAQWPVPVLAGDTADELAARVLKVEHILYPLAAAHLSRALDAGISPTRLSPPGDAFQIGGTVEVAALRRQISEAFEAAG